MNDGPDVDMEKLAALARIHLTAEEQAAFHSQIRDILGFFQQLQTVDVSGIEPLAHPFETPAPLRDDVPGESWGAERALLNAPASRDEQLVVPKVVEEVGGVADGS